MSRVVIVIVAVLLFTSLAFAQSGQGTLVGYAKDEQGGVLPGVTITATGPALLKPVVVVTDGQGYYRLLNLPPGQVLLTAELQGFSVFKREGILVRAGATFQVDVTMTIGSLQETVTVKGDSPMLEVSKPGTTITIDGSLLRAVPLTARKLWSDAIDMTPGVGSRTTEAGSGQMAYYALGSDIWSGSFLLEGAPASAFADQSATTLALSGDTISDVEIKVGGVDAASPLSTGVVVNIVAPRGGNQFTGTVGWAFQPKAWNGNNMPAGISGAGVATKQMINQFDASLGGPIAQNKVWFFGSIRMARLANGVSRSATDLATLAALKPGFQPFDQRSLSNQPFFKVTAKLSDKHELSAFYQYDRQRNDTNNTDIYTSRLGFGGYGGSMVSARLNSVWTNRLATQVLVSYSNKSREGEDSFQDLNGSGPQVEAYQSAFLSAGKLVGSGALAIMNNAQSITLWPSSQVTIRADLTYYREAWKGSHEFKIGLWLSPRLRASTTTIDQNDGFIFEEDYLTNPNNPASPLIPFHRRYVTPTTLATTATRDSDMAVYAQDSWKPGQRMTVNAGVRVDRIRRYDDIYDTTRMKNTTIGPRVGLSYLVTSNARNVLRFSYSRIAEQVAGRDSITSYGQAPGQQTTDTYDLNHDGVFETTFITPALTPALASLQFSPNLRQPWVNEFVGGYRTQLPGELSIDVSLTRRYYKDIYQLVDINGIYPSAPGQPFGGFGLVDPNRGVFDQEQNDTWSTTVITDFEAVVAKNLSHNIQLMASFTRQWDHLDGTWNPTDPARFIQPDAFADNRDIPLSRGNNDDNMLDGRGRPVGAAWRPYSLRIAGQYLAPWGFTLAASFVAIAGDYSGPVVTKIAAADPTFGPATFTLANGIRVSNPLATTIRFAYPTRGDGQVENDTVRYLQLKVARRFKFGRPQIEVAAIVQNVFNAGSFQQYNASGPNQLYSLNYLAKTALQPPRALQIATTFRF